VGLAAIEPPCQRKTEGGLEKGLANLWSEKKMKKITKKAYAGRGHESKWEIENFKGLLHLAGAVILLRHL
jgi:hypothetical protein